ncbi:MAG: hypothetical protein ACRDT0_23630 [Pseudonocardiaceae bacterium]
MSARHTAIAGRLSLWLAGLFTLMNIPVLIINLFRTTQIEFPLDLAVPYLFGTLASFIAYVYGRTELSLENQERILRQPGQDVEVFHTSEEFLNKLIEITVGAESVSTLNLSPARGEHANLDIYFQRIHTFIKARRSPLRSFRSIASLDTKGKMSFLIARSHELAPTGQASFAVFDQKSVGPLPHQLSLHITVKDGQSFVFLYPPVDLTGAMDSVLIRNETVAKVMLDYFNVLWHKSVVLNEGKRVRLSGLEHLASIDPTLRQNQYFRLLKETAS